MLVRCSHCGYQNNEHYRFCGMCGALLRLPDAEPAARVSEPASTPPPAHQTVAKPVPPAAANLDYLLEDEPEDHGHRRRMYLALVLLAIAGVVLLWQFSRGRESRGQSSAATSQPEAASAPGPEPVPTSTAPDSLPTATKDAATSHDTQTPTPARVLPQETASSAPSEKVLPVDEKPAAAAVDQPKKSAATDSQPTNQPVPSPAEQTPLKDAPPKPAPAPRTAPAKPVVPSPKASEVPPMAADSTDDKLVAAGEKYLYGNGVAENCAAAQKNLRAAAQHSNPKAQSILGTMYATGHCVDRDLPMAYRWFAKALHQDPSNNRIQRDLEVLWRQMTADERQLAIRP